VALIRAGIRQVADGGSRCGHSFAASIGGMMGCALGGSARSISGGDRAKVGGHDLHDPRRSATRCGHAAPVWRARTW
jgi:hypothetical protein